MYRYVSFLDVELLLSGHGRAHQYCGKPQTINPQFGHDLNTDG